jgi:hypothetical protein
MAVTIIQTIPNPGSVPVSPANGEFLFFRVSGNGPIPRFRWASDVKGTLLNQGMFPSHPTTVYEWTYLRDPSDVQQFEQLSVAFLFAANSDYRFQVSIQDATGPVRDVLDISYSGGSTDFESELFRVLIV